MQEQPIKGNISLYDPSMEPWDQGQSELCKFFAKCIYKILEDAQTRLSFWAFLSELISRPIQEFGLS